MSDLSEGAVKRARENEDRNVESFDLDENKYDYKENILTTNKPEKFLTDKSDIINEYKEKTIEKVNQISQDALNVFARSSDYIKNFDVQESKKRINDLIKSKPELSLVAAGVVGLVVGWLISKKRK